MKRVVGAFTRICEAYLPDAFVFCLILTLIVFGAGLLFTPHSAPELVNFWGKDFWSLNAFAMQMVFVLITGHMLATAPVFQRLLARLTEGVHSETSALVLISIFSTITCWINWGFGLIISGVLALELARKLGRVNFGLFIATAYSGFLVWHGGLSGSIPLKIAGHDEIMAKIFPGLTIPLSQTIFSAMNITIVAGLLISLPMLALMMRTDNKVTIPPAEDRVVPLVESNGAFRDKIETSPALNIIFFIFFLMIMVTVFRQDLNLDINRVNFIFLFTGLLLHRTPRQFLRALNSSIVYAAGIVIQFPFYAGIMGLMQYSGLADLISQVFVTIASPSTLPLWTFISGGIVNFFVPSGGGQWVVQGPIMLQAAKDIGADPARVSMALAWGDAWTNMIQPFWALPLLGLAGIGLKDIMGYCLIFLIWSGLVIAAVLYLF